MSQQKENVNAKQSPLDPEKMENEAKHFKNRETDSLSRPSSWGSENIVSSTLSIISVISDIASIVVSGTLDRTSSNINELMQSISWWEAEERSKSETDDDEGKSSADCRTNQKVEQQLKRFFGLRQIFAEHKGETVKDTKEDRVTEMDSTQAPSGQDGHHVPTNGSTHGIKVIERMKSAFTHYFKLGKKAEEENLDGSPCPDGLSSDHLEGEHEDVTVVETIYISSTVLLTGSSQPEEHYEVLRRSEAEQKDEIVGLASSNSTSKNTNLRAVPIYMDMDAPSWSEKAPPTASICSNEDNKAAKEADRKSDPVQLVDVKHEDIPPQTKVPSTLSPTGSSRPLEHHEVRSAVKEDNLVTGSKRSSEVCETVTQKSCNSVGTDEKSAGARERKTFKKMTSAWNTFFRSKPRENVQLTTGHDLDDAVELQTRDSNSGSPCPEEASSTASIHSSEDNRAAEESDLTSVPLELVDVADKDVTPQEKEDVASKPSTLSSLPPVEHHTESSSVTEKELVKYSVSTPGPSEQDRHPEGFQEDNRAAALPQLVGLKTVFYTIIKRFFDSLTEEDLRGISKGVYNTDVKDKLAHNCAEVLRLVVETITDILSQATNQSAPPHATLTRRSPTSSQACGAVGQNFVFTEDTLQQSLKTTFSEAYCEVIGTDTSVSMTSKFTEAIMRAVTDEVNSVLSETIQASQSGGSSHVHSDTCCKFSSCRACKKMLVIRAIKSLLTQFETRNHSDCESKDDKLTHEHTVKVHKKKLPWWSCFCNLLKKKKKVHPVSDEQMDEAVTLSPNKLSSGLSSSPKATSNTCSKPSSKQNSIPLEIVDYASEDEEFPTEFE